MFYVFHRQSHKFVSLSRERCCGVIMGHQIAHFGGIKQCKGMVFWRDSPDSALFGLVILIIWPLVMIFTFLVHPLSSQSSQLRCFFLRFGWRIRWITMKNSATSWWFCSVTSLLREDKRPCNLEIVSTRDLPKDHVTFEISKWFHTFYEPLHKLQNYLTYLTTFWTWSDLPLWLL